MIRPDAEVAADVGNDGADGAAADLGGDLLGRGQAEFGSGPGRGETGGRRSMTGSAWPRGLGIQTRGCADDPGFERLGTEEAAGDARQDQGDVAGAEGVRSAAERGGELFAVVNELADEAEEAAGAAGLWVDGGLSG